MSRQLAAAPAMIRVALVRRTHGVRGEVRVESLGGGSRRFRKGLELSVESSGRRLVVAAARAVSDTDLLLAFEGVGTPEAAALLRGAYLCVPTAKARRLGRNEWFVWQLIGLEAVDMDGRPIGVVSDIEAGPVQDIVVVNAGAVERRFPMVSSFVAGVDLGTGRMVLTPWDED